MAAEMTCYPLIAVQAFYRGLRVTDFQLFFYQSVWDRVIVAFHLHMIIEVDGDFFPLGHFVG